MNKVDELLLKFVKPDIPAIAKPVLSNDFVAATNGHVIVCVPKRLIGGEYSETTIKNMLDVLQTAPRLPSPLKFNTKQIHVAMTERDKERWCETALCSNCKGATFCECLNCESRHKCPDCDGSGISERPENIAEFCGVQFNPFYLDTIFNAIEAITGGDFEVTSLGEDASMAGSAAVFVAGDLQIGIMPMRKTSNKKRVINLTPEYQAV